jgi:hypothetical protein
LDTIFALKHSVAAVNSGNLRAGRSFALAIPSAMQHKKQQMGSQMGSASVFGVRVKRNSNMIANDLTAALAGGRLTLLTIVLISARTGAAEG